MTNEVRGAWQCQSKVKVMNITRLGERCITVSLQVQGSDKTKLEVHGIVRVH